jgi:hypothetical protein
MEDIEIRSTKNDICVLWHLKTKRILCVTPFTSAANAILASEVELAMNLIPGRKPVLHSKEKSSQLLHASPSELVGHIFHRQSGSVVKLDKSKAKATKEILSHCELLSSRSRYLNRVTRVVTRARNRFAPSEKYADLVEILRRDQAVKFRDAGYDESMIQDCLFVFQYAQVKKMTPQEAAEEIIFRFKLFEASLWKTEEIRMKYYDLFSNAKTVEETHEFFQEFIREYYLNSRV